MTSFSEFPGAPSIDTSIIERTVPNVLQQYRQGQADAQADQRRQLGFEVGGKLASGDVMGARSAAFAGGDIKTAIDVSTWDEGRRMKALQMLQDGAQRADTPAKWNALVRSAESTFGPQMVANYRDFSSRPNAMTVLQQAQLDLEKRQLAISQANAARQAALANAQLQQIKNQSVEGKLKFAQQIGLKHGSPEWQYFMANGSLPAKAVQDPITSAVAGMLLRSQQVQPTTPPSSPASPVKPMSAPVESEDPNLIRTQVAAGQDGSTQPQPQPDMVNTPLGQMPLDQARRIGMGLALVGKGDAGKMLTEAANADKLSQSASNENQKDMLGLTGTIGRLEAISRRFDPKFLEVGKRIGFTWNALAEKAGLGNSLDPKDKAELARFTKFRQASVQNAALYVKYLSGVAVSEAEFKRIMTTLPNAGTGIFDGDSPTEFQAKMGEATTQAKMAYARAKYLQTQGFKGKPWEAGIALDDMRGIIDQRGAQIEQEMRGRVPPQQMNVIIRRQLKQEFGI